MCRIGHDARVRLSTVMRLPMILITLCCVVRRSGGLVAGNLQGATGPSGCTSVSGGWRRDLPCPTVFSEQTFDLRENAVFLMRHLPGERASAEADEWD